MNSCIVASKEHISCNLDDEVVLLSLQTGEYYGLNIVAASIWTLIQEPRPVSGVRDTLLLEYDGITPEACGEQVLALLTEMLQLHLIEIC